MEQPDRRLRKEIEDLTINQPELTDTYPKNTFFQVYMGHFLGWTTRLGQNLYLNKFKKIDIILKCLLHPQWDGVKQK